MCRELAGRRRVGRAIAVGETKGLVKVIVERDSDELLGMHIVSQGAGDLLPQGMAMLHTPERTINPLVEALVTHPTLSEGVKAAITNLKPTEGIPTPAGDLSE